MFNELGGVLVEETEGKWQLECVYIDRTPKILSYHPYHLFQPSVHVVKGDKRTQGDIMIKDLGWNVKSRYILQSLNPHQPIYSALNRGKVS